MILRDKVLYVLFSVTLMGVIGVSILAPAFPRISEELEITKGQVAMLVTVFALPGIFLAPIMGMLADRLGRKVILVPSLFLFAIAGTLCAFVDFRSMLILRFLQGIGGSTLSSLSATLIGDIYPEAMRPKLLGYNASVLSVGTTVYPIIGGLLTGIDWRAPFFMFLLAVPVGLMVMKIKAPSIRRQDSIKEQLRRITLLFMDLRLLKWFITGMVVFLALYGSLLTYLPFLLKGRFEASPVIIGATISAISVSSGLVALKLGYFTEKLKGRGTIMLGLTFYTISLVIMPFLWYLPLFAVATALFGLGNGLALPSLQNLVLKFTPMENRAVAMTAFSATIRVGQTIGPFITSLIALYSIEYVFLFPAIIFGLLLISYR
jgi:MFS family permease